MLLPGVWRLMKLITVEILQKLLDLKIENKN